MTRRKRRKKSGIPSVFERLDIPYYLGGSKNWVLGYFEPFAVLQGRLVGDDPADGHVRRAAEMDIPGKRWQAPFVRSTRRAAGGKRCLPPFPQGGKFVFAARLQCLGDINQRRAVLENGKDELVRELSMRATMPARFDAGRKRRALDVGQLLHGATVLVTLHPPSFAKHATGLASLTADAFAHEHAGGASLGSLEERNLVGEEVAVFIGAGLIGWETRVGTGTGHGSERLIGDTDVISGGMCGIPQRNAANSPVLVGSDLAGVKMVILTLGVDEFAESTGLIDLAHGVKK